MFVLFAERMHNLGMCPRTVKNCQRTQFTTKTMQPSKPINPHNDVFMGSHSNNDYITGLCGEHISEGTA